MHRRESRKKRQLINVRGRGGDDGQLEAGAVGLARGEGQEAGAGTGDLTVAVVASAGTLLEDRAEGKASEGEDDGGLHFDGWVKVMLTRGRSID